MLARVARLALLLTALVGLLYVLSVLSMPGQYTLPLTSGDMRATHDLFKKEIQTFGGTNAYTRMGVAIAQLPVEEQHGYAHTFGHELYLAEGEKGISVCDAQYNLGCFHQFLGDAIADMGTTSVTRLYNECGAVIGNRDTCMHGLGHGILSAFGYKEQDLEQALALCAAVTHVRGYSGCSGGVFMEYNLRTIASAEGRLGIRPPEHDIYAPCSQVPANERSTCLFWLPQWWFMSEQDFGVLGTRCAASEFPQPCFEGIGYIAPVTLAFNPGKIRAACDRVGESGHGRAYCRSMAALIQSLTYQDRSRGTQICDGLPRTEAPVCVRYTEHRGDFSFTIPDAL